MKILLGILLLLAAYYVILFLFVFKGNGQLMFFFRKKHKNDVGNNIHVESFEQIDIVGKSKGYIPEPAEIATLELEVDMEYAEEFQPEDTLDEETLELEEEGFTDYSSGITFEELQLVLNAVQNENVPEETETKAGGIISTIGQTDMFELLLQFSNGRQKVDDLLKRHVNNS